MQVLLEKYLAEFAAVIIYMYIPFFFFPRSKSNIRFVIFLQLRVFYRSVIVIPKPQNARGEYSRRKDDWVSAALFPPQRG